MSSLATGAGAEHAALTKPQGAALTVKTPAAHAVFRTAELVENILVHLDICEIVLAQRISKDFRDGIASSVIIQEKLFTRLRNKGQTWRVRSHGSPQLKFISARLVSDTYDLPENDESFDFEKRWVPSAINSLLVRPERALLLKDLCRGEMSAGPTLLKGLLHILAGNQAPLLDKMHFTDGPSSLFRRCLFF
ncbi:hypothetical protein BST61_g1892 [Cercospora zeina]